MPRQVRLSGWTDAACLVLPRASMIQACPNERWLWSLVVPVAVISVNCSSASSSRPTEPGALPDSDGGAQSNDGAAQSNDARDAAPTPPKECVPANQLAPGDHDLTLSSGGLVRTYRLHVPAAPTGTARLPLVIELHGGGSAGGGVTFDKSTGWVAKGEKEGFLVAMPDGAANPQTQKRYWNSGVTCGSSTAANIDDVAFLRALIDDVSAKSCLDGQRVFATGHSEGAAMAHRLGCQLSDKLAAIAPASSGLNQYPRDPHTTPGQTPAYECTPSSAVSVYEMHGLKDCANPYDGGFTAGGGCQLYNPSIPETNATWGLVDQCSATNVAVVENTADGTISCVTRTGCKAGAEVVLCTLGQAGHEWPGSGKDACAPPVGDATPMTAWSGTEHAWEFFKSHPKP